jgi:DNA-binding MarR family transcriptional regulator
MTKLLQKDLVYAESIWFQIRLTSRYLNLMGNQAFEKLNFSISFDDYILLDIIANHEDICPRDLARMLLRDRSNVGKIVSGLEDKKLIKVKADIRNNRSVKKLRITDKGIKLCNEMYLKIQPYIDVMNKVISEKDQKKVASLLEKCRKTLDEIVETQI